MDFEWAESVLIDWLEVAARAKVAGNHGTSLTSHSSHVDQLLEGEDRARRVVARINGLRKLPALISRHQTYYLLEPGIQSVKYALGRLRTDAETRSKLGSSAPAMSAEALHPSVWTAAAALWSDGHYGAAVQRAATMINAEVQDRVDRHDLSDAALMQEVFSSSAPAPGRPRLRWPGEDSDLTVRSMRDGLTRLGPGVFMTIRNPITHDAAELDRQVGLEQLSVLSQLARWMERCEVLRGEAEEG